MLYQKDGAMLGRIGDFNSDSPNETVFSTPITVTTDEPTDTQNVHLTGGFNWISWKTEDKHRVALYPESPKVMKINFYKGFILGVHIRHVAMRKAPLGDILSLVPEYIKTEDANIDFYNGFIIGVII